MRHADTYRSARKRQAKRERIIWRNVPFCRVTLAPPIVKDGRQISTGKAFKMKMVPTAIAARMP